MTHLPDRAAAAALPQQGDIAGPCGEDHELMDVERHCIADRLESDGSRTQNRTLPEPSSSVLAPMSQQSANLIGLSDSLAAPTTAYPSERLLNHRSQRTRPTTTAPTITAK